MAAPTETAPAAANPAPAAGKGNGKPCFSFSKYGECKYGADCKYSHDKADAKPVAARADAPAGGRGGARGGRGGRGGARGGAAGAAGPRPIRLKKPCRAFQNGEECPYGDKCHFSHDPAGDKQKFLVAQAKRAIEDKKSLCVWIQKGVVCPHGSICRHSHQIPDAKAAPAAAAPAAAAPAAAAKPAAAAPEQRAAAPAAAAPAVVAAAAGQAPAAKPAAHVPAPAGAHQPAPKQTGGQAKGHGKRPNHQLQQPKH